MDIQKDLEEMEARMFTDELLDKILNEYWQEIAPLFVVLNGEEYEAEERAFSARLTKKQAGKFAEAVLSLCRPICSGVWISSGPLCRISRFILRESSREVL